jgi:hypothetical protein
MKIFTFEIDKKFKIRIEAENLDTAFSAVKKSYPAQQIRVLAG